MGGYAARDGVATSTLDDLEANLLYLRDEHGVAVAWVSIDVLAIARPVRELLSRVVSEVVGIPRENVIVVATHTHSGPRGWHGEIHPVLPGELDPAACAELSVAVREAATGLARALAPARISWRVGSVHGAGGNRHEPEGPHDNSTGVLVVYPIDGEDPLALLYDYACHPTVLGPEHMGWSADWVGGARDWIRSEFPDAVDLPVVFLQGCAGDVSPRFYRRGRNVAETERLGGIVGAAVAASALEATPIANQELSMERRVVELPVRSVSSDSPDGQGLALTHVGKSPDVAVRLDDAREEATISYAALASADLPTTLELPVSFVSVGPISWLHLPVELSAEYGMSIRRNAAHLRVVGYADDYCGYVVDPKSHRNRTYEAQASFLDASTSESFVAWCRDYVARSYETSTS